MNVYARLRACLLSTLYVNRTKQRPTGVTSMDSQVTILGGGNGTASVINALRNNSSERFIAVSGHADSGGCTGRRRLEYPWMPPIGDFRQHLFTLRGPESDITDQWNVRLDTGDHFLNLYICNILCEYGLDKGLKVLHEKFQLGPHRAYFVSHTPCTLHAELRDGTVLSGEHLIDEIPTNGRKPIQRTWLTPEPVLCNEVRDAILESDVIIIPPGDIYTSLAPIFHVPMIQKHIRRSRAFLIYCVNLMQKPGQTDGWSATDHVLAITNMVGRMPDAVIVNTGVLPTGLAARYQRAGAGVVQNDLARITYGPTIVEANLIDTAPGEERNDAIAHLRSLVRHNPDVLREAITRAIQEHGIKIRRARRAHA